MRIFDLLTKELVVGNVFTVLRMYDGFALAVGEGDKDAAGGRMIDDGGRSRSWTSDSVVRFVAISWNGAWPAISIFPNFSAYWLTGRPYSAP
jgi:hypothetical protein